MHVISKIRRNERQRMSFMIIGLIAIVVFIASATLAHADTIESVGTIAANRSTVVSARLDAVVTSVNVELGDRVNTDTVLVSLDPIAFSLSLEAANAELEMAKAEYKAKTDVFTRAKALAEKNQLARAEFDAAQNAVAVARASVAKSEVARRQAKEVLSQTSIHAPYTAFIASRSVEQGQTVTVGMPLLTLLELDSVRVKFSVIERDLVRLQAGMAATIFVDVLPGLSFSGAISHIGVAPNTNTGTYPVEILINNKNHRLKPGFTVRVKVKAEKDK